MINSLSSIEFSFDIATFVTILGTVVLLLFEMARRQKKDAIDRLSEEARSVAIERVHIATERLAELIFQVLIVRFNTANTVSKILKPTPYILGEDRSELDWLSVDGDDWSWELNAPLRNLNEQRLQRFSDGIAALDPLISSFLNLATEVYTQSTTIKPFLKPSSVTGGSSNKHSLDQMFGELGQELQTLYREQRNGIDFLKKVEVALKQAHDLTITPDTDKEEWKIYRAKLGQIWTKNDFNYASFFLPFPDLKKTYDRCKCPDELKKLELEIINQFSYHTAEKPGLFFDDAVSALLSGSNSINEVTDRILLILTCTTERLVSEFGASATERYQDRETQLPKRKYATVHFPFLPKSV